MSKKTNEQIDKRPKRKLSKRERRMRIFVYIMIIAMILSTFTAGAAGLFL